jgi:hypothetical protein
VFMLEAERLALHHERAKEHGFRDRNNRDGIPARAGGRDWTEGQLDLASSVASAVCDKADLVGRRDRQHAKQLTQATFAAGGERGDLDQPDAVERPAIFYGLLCHGQGQKARASASSQGVAPGTAGAYSNGDGEGSGRSR